LLFESSSLNLHGAASLSFADFAEGLAFPFVCFLLLPMPASPVLVTRPLIKGSFIGSA
jgi:hypothetical protein